MIEVAVQRACELGLLPRRTLDEDVATNTEIMLDILQSALDAEPDGSSPGKVETVQ